MAKYSRGEARQWAKESLVGCCGCVTPTFTADLSDLNEEAIRHDIRMEKRYGMSAVLIVSEAGTTLEEMARFCEIVVDEAGDDLITVLQASQPTLAETVASAEDAARVGVDLVMPSYPLYFRPSTFDEVFDFTKAVASASELGLIIFGMDAFGFGCLHPSGFPIDLLERMVEEIPQVCAIKNEIGAPGVGGIAAVFEAFRDRVVVSDPQELNAPAWIANYGMRFMGTSNYETFAGEVPRMLGLLSEPSTWDEGMDLYWKLAPVRQANAAVCSNLTMGSGLVPRMHAKYQGWLVGFNGGPIRQPHMRISAAQMGILRRGAEASGLPVTDADDDLFYVGRNPK
ncbi:dihydrodipicolinate synthase family protein [Rhodococcus koreensis]|uniref:dihydrodipicolinate synthase family protein n=1 Tax=Rhodococcus koreensis TaxID=99653 RepID=UPI001981543C|nr:dihydrodipicolinate synthase family protein [Rhodococcus koreensis]QSE86083.1 dihydrodipicolinate synthase family protein [Rhodococcus koreensis]